MLNYDFFEQFNEEKGVLSITGVPVRKLTEFEKIGDDFIQGVNDWANSWFNRITSYLSYNLFSMNDIEQLKEKMDNEMYYLYVEAFKSIGVVASISDGSRIFQKFIEKNLKIHKELILNKIKIRIKEELDKYIGKLSHEEIAKIISAKL